jgi:hypothetical protein
MHPAELALVEVAARLTALELVERRRGELDRLRARAAPLLARLSGDALCVDSDGHLAAAVGSRMPNRVALPDDLDAGPVWLPTLGAAHVEPLAGGWLLRLGEAQEDTATELVLELGATPCLRVASAGGSWSRRLSPRHAEIVAALIEAGPAGRSATALAEDLFGDAGRTATVRAEMSRLRRAVGSVLHSGPYRISTRVVASLELPAHAGSVLPGSSAPVVIAIRGRVSSR